MTAPSPTSTDSIFTGVGTVQAASSASGDVAVVTVAILLNAAKQSGSGGGAWAKAGVAARAASRGAIAAAGRYGAVRGLLACVGPALWTWFLADLGWRAVATNYGRVIPVVFAIAQIRLTRSEGDFDWTVAPAT